MNSKRILYFDALKILAAYFVILLHVTAEQYYTYTYDLSWYINYGYNALSRWAVPVFCMVTGALMLSRELSISAGFKKSILRIALILFFWGMYYWLVPSMDFSLPKIWEAFRSLISGKAYSHLWYLYMLLGFYIVAPLLSIITKNASKRTIEYFLAVLFAASFVIPSLSKQIPFLSGLLSSLKFSFVGLYLLYFLAGYYLNNYRWKKWTQILYACLGIALLIGTAVGYSGIYSMRTGTENGLPSIIIVLGATSIFVLFQLMEPVLFVRKPFSSVIGFVSPLTFGIYLLHFRVEKRLLAAGIHSCMIDPILGAPLVSLAIFIITAVIVWVITRIPVVRRLVNA